jgi:hypothetical protein
VLDLELPGNIQGGTAREYSRRDCQGIFKESQRIFMESPSIFFMFRRAASTGFNKDFVKISKEYLI